MTPAFASWQQFFTMGGYAFYVWLAVACTLIPLIGLLLHTLLQHRHLLASIRQRQVREQRIRAAKMDQTSAVPGEEP